MGVVASIRIAAYYKEDLAKDLAKMLPLALLGIFLLDMTAFSFSESVAIFGNVPAMIPTLFYYWVFVIALEFILRILNLMVGSKKDTLDEVPSDDDLQ